MELTGALNLDLVCAAFGNLVIPLGDGLGCDPERVRKPAYAAEMVEDLLKAVHPKSVSVLPDLVKSPYSRHFTPVSKLPYMQKKKRELDPRAVSRGRAILRARTDKRLSQGNVAEALGVSREAVSNWERGAVGEIERSYRLGLCKLLGFQEAELLLDPEGAETEFDMPLSREAKSIAYRWDDLPESLRAHLKSQIAEAERMQRESPELAKRIYPELEERHSKPKK